MLEETIKEVEKLQAAQQSHLHSYPPRQSTQCPAIMTGVSSAKRLAIWLAIAHTYAPMMAIIMGM